MEMKKSEKPIDPELDRVLTADEREREFDDHTITEEEEELVPDDDSEEVWDEENPSDVEDSRRRSV